MKDSYDVFCKKMNIKFDDFIEFGISNTIYPNNSSISDFWNELKHRIDCGEIVYVRGKGRNGKTNNILIDFYKMFGINIKIDSTNNSKPTRNLQVLCRLKKTGANPDVVNYQVSHIFGRTKNVYMFESPWNVCFVPKMFDPLTGHEASGRFSVEYKKKWLEEVKTNYSPYIADYNSLMKKFDIKRKLDRFITDKNIQIKYTTESLADFYSEMEKEFEPID